MSPEFKTKLKKSLIEHKNITSNECENVDPLVGIYFESLCDIIDEIFKL